jgi:hypothetical protein
MRRLASVLLLCGLLAPTPVAVAADAPCRDSAYAGDLAALFAAPRELGSDWDAVRESPSNPADDRELHAGGVTAVRSLHYTRARPDGSEVCSLEIWRFATAAAARRAHPEIGSPGWRIDSRANLVLMTRGTTLSRDHGFRPGLLPECQRLADLAQARVLEILGCEDSR